jgi:hypothetical protein
MERISFDLPQQKWGTLNSKYKPETKYVTSDELTVGSYNFVTNIDGSLTKRPTDVVYNATVLADVAKDQFEAIFASGVHHLLLMVSGTLKYSTGDSLVATAHAGYTANANMEYTMYQNRVYYDNGIDNPGVYDLTTSYGGVSYTFPTQTIKSMGCQPPGSAVTYAADSGTGLTGSFHYKVTFLYYDLEESNGGTASTLHTVANKTINLTAIPIGGYGVTARKIYRDANDGNYVLIATISDNTTTTYADSTTSGTTAIPTANNLPPVFSYIALNLSRLWVAGVSGTPTTLYWSSAGLPDIFDPNSFLICNPKDPIQALYVYQGVTYVFNRHSFGRINGSTDDSFAYEEFPGSVGCVDNRSLQVRTINGVPTLVWLSDRGLYAFNGSSADYISDRIEDIVNLNIQQVNFVTGSNNQSSQADFQAGTYTGGIDLVSEPGVITTFATLETFEAKADWESGSSLVNIATADGSNQLKVPVSYTPTLASGSLGGTAILSTNSGQADVTLTLSTNQTVPSVSPDGNQLEMGVVGDSAFPVGIGQQFTMQHDGTIPAITVYHGYINSGDTKDYRIRMCSDAVGLPGSVLYETTGSFVDNLPFGSTASIVVHPSVAVTANIAYWWTFEILGPSGEQWMPASPTVNSAAQLTSVARLHNGAWMSMAAAGSWGVVMNGPNNGSLVRQLPCTVSFTQTAISATGTWQSPVYDSYSVGSAVLATVKSGHTGTIDSGSNQYPVVGGVTPTATIFVDASNDATFSTGVSTVSQASPNDTYSLSLSNKRYWRIRYSLSTTDNRTAAVLRIPAITFSTTGTWISPVIDCTVDVTAYNAITLTDNVPAGTTVTVTVATSTDNISYSSFVALGSAVVARYVKVKIVMTTTSDNANTPSVSLLRFSWNLQSTFTSSIINTGQVPSGWGLFQDVASVGTGTVTFYMRSAASSGGIPGATFHAVTNGAFPDAAILPNQYVQWKVVLTTLPGTLPTVESVTINWFLGNNQSPIRTASLFYDKTYYLAAAETNQTTNNIVICYDQEGNWRLFRGLTINSLGLFFNQPFYLDSVRPNIYQWLVPANGAGSSITMDVRTKAFDLNEPKRLKNVRGLEVCGINTGTTVHAYYSVDRGTTWVEMLNSSGVVAYTTTTDLNKFNEYFVPNYDLGSSVSGVTIMFRVTSTDAYPCSVLSLKPEMYVREGKYIGRAL